MKDLIKNIYKVFSKKLVFRHSLRQLYHSKTRVIMLGLLTLILLICWCNVAKITSILPPVLTDNILIDNIPFLPKNTVIYAFLIVIYAISLLIILADITSDKYDDNFRMAGIVNKSEVPPIFIRKYRSKHNPGLMVLEFDPNGTDMELWKNKQSALSNTFENSYIHNISQDGKRIQLRLGNGSFTDQQPIYWRQSLLPENSSKLVLGVDESFEQVILDLNTNYHIKIGGMSGSGKTMLQQLIIVQLLLHEDSKIYIADLKGWDYTGIWQQLRNCTIVRDIFETYNLINTAYEDMQSRDEQLREVKTTEERTKLYKSWKRIVVIIEEATDLFIRPARLKELSPDNKAKYLEMQEKLELIARKGRACKMNLFINTQRPDAESLPKDLNSNLDYAVCGKADPILSRVVLDNTDAHEKIPKDKAGFFVNNNGVFFRAYLLDNVEDTLRSYLRK